jgi:predicted transposase YbfD/YdcC
MNEKISIMFKDLEDSRVDRTKKHPFESILYIVMCGIFAGISTWTGFEEYAVLNEDLFITVIDLPNGIPSHDTISKVIESLSIEDFEENFGKFIDLFLEEINSKNKEGLNNKVIAIDGKTIRGSVNKKEGVKARHIITAWVTGSKLSLGQIKVDQKTNEITAIPELLERINIAGHIITIDAMGCQRNICEKIIEKEGDFLIALKGNQGEFNSDVKRFFEKFDQDEQFKNKTIYSELHERENNKGRIEERHCISIDIESKSFKWIQDYHQWPHLKSISIIKSKRTEKNKTSHETRFFISSLDHNAKQISQNIRSHWSIENQLHWVLDVVYNEDKSKIRTENAPEILSIMRKWALAVANKHKGKNSLSGMTRRSLISFKYLLNLLENI